jgi:dTDP-4-dehydrorhamnose reductase
MRALITGAGGLLAAAIARHLADIQPTVLVNCAAYHDVDGAEDRASQALETAALSAPRPKFCAMSNAKLAAAGIDMPTWQDALRRYLHEG